MKQTYPSFIIFCILFILNTLTAVIYNLCNEIWLMMPIRLGAALINGAGVTLLTVLAIHYIHKLFHINLTKIVLFIAYFFFAIESFLLLNFYSLITPSIIMVTMETNHSEASEFFVSYFDIHTCMVLFSILIVGILLFYYYKKLLNIPLPAWLHKKEILIPTCTLTLLIYAGLTYYITHIRHMTSYQALTGIERVWHSSQNAMHDRAEYSKYLQLVKQDAPVLISNSSEVPYIIIILGESLSKLHMNAYGYQLPTTPKLSQRITNNETLKFDSVRTPRTVTSESIRQIMTFFDDSSTAPWYQYHTLPAVMGQAGYYTCWLSNQDSFTVGDDNSTASIASTSDCVKFSHQRHASEERYGYFDGELLTLLDQELKQPHEKAFFCLHLMGSHRRYTNRYPTEFSKFSINDITKNVSNEKKRTIAEYDNTVLYNDFVCDEIIKRFQNKDAIVFSFPDHGEEVYDTRNMCGHGLYNPSLPMQEIPFLIWTSDIFKEKHSDIIERMKGARNKPFNTANIIHTVMDICGIQTKDYENKKSLLNN